MNYYFGRSSSFVDDDCRTEKYLRDFWQNAVDGKRNEVFQANGRRTEDGILAPIACYDHRGKYDFDTGYILMQQGSYQLVPHNLQPMMTDGVLNLYRGIGTATKFKLLTLDTSEQNRSELQKY